MNDKNKHKEEVVRATQLWECGDITRENLEYIFPELKESEDERISREIIEFIMNFRNGNYEKPYDYTIYTIGTWVGWLEMQGKNPNKIESFALFKAGDCITDGEHTWFISDVCFNMYILLPLDSIVKVEDTISHVDKHFHLWSINDAKDGDILWHSDTASNGIFIFKEIRHDGKVLCYCDYDSEDHFCTGEYHTCCWSYDLYIKPATKEQRDLLFEKMHGAGYEWDAEKKELDKIEKQRGKKPIDKVEPTFKVGYWIVNNNTKNVFLIKSINNGYCTLEDIKGNIISPCLPPSENESHIWTIKDAKDGDVLYFNDNNVVIFKNLYCCSTFHSYCHIADGIFDISKDDMPDWWECEGFQPATKEQRELLFQKIRKAGYEWDENKKELRKIVVPIFWDAKKKELGKIVVPIFNIGDTIVKKHNSDIHDFDSFTVTDITGGKYWYNESIICDITEQNDWEIYEPVRQTTVEWSMDKVEKIKAEIERRKSLADEKKDNNIYFFARSDAYMELLNFIDSLEEDSDCK